MQKTRIDLERIKFRFSTSPYSVRMWENADQNNSKSGHFLRSVKELENLLDDDESLKVDNEFKIELDSIYDHVSAGIQVRSKSDWHKHDKKSSKFSLNLENQCGTQSQIRKFVSGNV